MHDLGDSKSMITGKFKAIYIGGCSGDDRLNNLINKQKLLCKDEEYFEIQSIQISGAQSDTANIFYLGEWPKEK